MSEAARTGLECLFPAPAVDAAVDRVAVAMSLELWDSNPLLVCLMNGALPFTADLMRRFYFPVELDYMHLTRYPSAGEEAGTLGGEVIVKRDLDRSLEGRTVVLVDDILDQGLTLAAAQELIARRRPDRLLTVVMVRKRRADAVAAADFVALDVPGGFVVGRGMDFSGAYRHLSGIYRMLPAGGGDEG